MINEPIIITPASGAINVFKAGVIVGGLAVAGIVALIAIATSSAE